MRQGKILGFTFATNVTTKLLLTLIISGHQSEKKHLLNPKNNGELVGIKRPFNLIEKEEKSHYICFID